MKKKLFLLAVALCGAGWAAQAQTQETFLTVSYTVQGSETTDDFSLAGGEVRILNNAVSVVYADNAMLNRSYVFDDVTSLSFERRNAGVGVESVNAAAFKTYIDGNGILQVTAEQALGTVRVYSLAGALVASTESDGNTAAINLSAQPKGAYIVQVGVNQIKIIK